MSSYVFTSWSILVETLQLLSSYILSSQIEQAFHEQLDLEDGVNYTLERCLLRVAHWVRGLHLDFPQRIVVCWDRLLSFWVNLKPR